MANTAIIEFLKQLKDDLSSSMQQSGQDKSGNISKSLRIEETDTGGTLYGWKWIYQRIETGRGVTVNGNAGGKTLRESIFEWLNKNNRGEVNKRSGIAFVISRKIHNEGDRLFRGEHPTLKAPTGTLTSIINDGRIDKLKRNIIVEIKDNLKQI